MNQVEVRKKQIHAIISLLGIVTWLLLGRWIGYHGIAYFAVAAECLAFVLSFLAERVPDALGRLLRGRSARGQYKNAGTTRISVLIFQTILGILGGLLLFLAADILAEKVFRMPYAMLAMRILAPALALRVLTGVLLGYFQGKGNLLPSLAVDLLRRILYLGFGCLFVRLLKNYGEKVSLLLLNDSMPSMYGAAGMAVGVALTEVLVLLFIAIVYLASGKTKKKQEEVLKKTETFFGAVGSLYSSRGPALLMDVLAFLPVGIGCILYQRSVEDIYASSYNYGIYVGGYLAGCAVPVLIISSILHSLAARTASAVRKGEQKYAKDIFGAGFHMTIILGLFASLFMTLMAKQISFVLAADAESALILTSFMQKGAAAVVLAVLSILFCRVLIYNGKTYHVIGALGIYVIVFVIGTVICFGPMKCEAEGLVIAGIAALLVLCIATGMCVFRQLRAKMDLMYWIGIPCLAVLVCGIIWYLVGRFLTPHLGYAMTMILGLILGSVVYWAILIVLRSFSRQEVEILPGGWILNQLKEWMRVV